MDAISLVMFSLVFIIGFVFSIFGITDLARSVEAKKTPWLAFISSLIATIVWMSFYLVWVASATDPLYVGFGYLWFAFMWVFLTLTLLSVGLIFRYSVKPEKEDDGLKIRERVM